MRGNAVNGWREVLARVFKDFEVELSVTPEWLINPDTGRRLKLDYLYPQIGVAVRFVGLEGTGRRRRKSDEEVEADANREDMRAALCRQHQITLISINPDVEPRDVLRGMETALARAASQLALSSAPQAEKQAYMPMLGQARRRVGEFTTRLNSIKKLNLYAELWYDRQAALAAVAPVPAGPARSYAVDMEVMHTKFGPGRVTAVQPDGDDMMVTVDFVEAGVRTFCASLVGDKLVPG